MVTTSTLMENLRQEGVSPDLLLAVNEYRTTHPLTEALAPRVPQSAFTYYGKDVWEQALAALLCGEKPVRVADAGELAGIRTELKKIGTNLNQAVRALNTYGSDPVVLNNLNRATSIVSTAVGWVNDLLARARE